MANGNGVNFDISDDSQFRAFCVQQFGVLMERTAGLSELKTEHAVMKQEIADIQTDMKDAKKWENIKMAVGPVMVFLHGLVRALGFHI